MEAEGVFSSQIAEHVVSHAFIGNPVKRLFHRHEIAAQITREAFKDHGINGGEPTDGAIGIQRFIQFFPSVAFELDRYRTFSQDLTDASAQGGEQSIIDRKLKGAEVRADEASGLFRAEGHGEPGKFAGVILAVGQGKGFQLFLNCVPVRNFPGKAIAGQVVTDCLCIIGIGLGLRGKLNRFAGRGLGMGCFKI